MRAMFSRSCSKAERLLWQQDSKPRPHWLGGKPEVIRPWKDADPDIPILKQEEFQRFQAELRERILVWLDMTSGLRGGCWSRLSRPQRSGRADSTGLISSSKADRFPLADHSSRIVDSLQTAPLS